MAIANPYQQYRHNVVNSSTPQELTLMLYNGLIKFLKLSHQAIEENDKNKIHSNISRAQSILEEFMSSLDMNFDISKNLYSLYDFMYWHLVDANISNDGSKVEEVIALAEELRNTWNQAMKIAKGQQ